MSRRLLTAALIVVALLADRVTAKPPDLPLPQNDVLAPATPAPTLQPALFPPAAAPTLEPSLFFRVRPSVRRVMASCLLFGADPLLALAPTEEYVDFDEEDAPAAFSVLFGASLFEELKWGGLIIREGVWTRSEPPEWAVRWAVPDKALALASGEAAEPTQRPFPGQAGAPEESPSVCPWMREQQRGPDRQAVLSTDIDLSHEVLDNLKMLRTAHELLGDARELGRAGRLLDALDCLVQADDLCPNVWFDEKVREATAEIFADSYGGSPRDDEASKEQSEPRAKETLKQKLSRQVSLQFNETPFREVIDDLRIEQGINIYVDTPALEAENFNLDWPVTVKLENDSLKSAMNLILKSVHLIYFAKGETLVITTQVSGHGAPEECDAPCCCPSPTRAAAAPLRPFLPPVDPQVLNALDGLYPETAPPLQLTADDEEPEPPADVRKGVAKPFVKAADLEEVGCAKDGGADDNPPEDGSGD